MNENINATGKDNVTTNDDADVLKQIRDLSKKRLILQAVSTVCVAGMFAAVLIAVLVMVPRVSTTLAHINDVATRAQESLVQVDDMTASMIKASGDLSGLVDENGEALASAVKSMSEIDFEGLNKAITDLQDAIGPMANFMNRFR